MGRRAIFMDRDGTVCEEVGYVNHVDRIRLLPRSAAAIKAANDAGYQTVVVTNQAGVARGYFAESLVDDVHDRVRELLAEQGARLDGIYFCPHHPDDGCRCRKPNIGMVERAVSELQLDLRRSYLIGDHARDIQLAHRVGAKAILITTSLVDAQALDRLKSEQAMPDAVAKSMSEAVDWILNDAAMSAKGRDEREKRERQES